MEPLTGHISITRANSEKANISLLRGRQEQSNAIYSVFLQIFSAAQCNALNDVFFSGNIVIVVVVGAVGGGASHLSL